jgi:hypothetical protein
MGASTSAWVVPCDFLTGGGFIVRDVTGEHANFGIGGGCKFGSPTWGHLEYHDHGIALNVHATSITGYFFVDDGTGVDPQTGQPLGTRIICGTASTNLYGDVDWAAKVQDKGEPGDEDIFVIRLRKFGVDVYTTEGDSNHTLGGSGSGGGNINLHQPNNSTTGVFGGKCAAAPLETGG